MEVPKVTLPRALAPSDVPKALLCEPTVATCLLSCTASSFPLVSMAMCIREPTMAKRAKSTVKRARKETKKT